MEETQPPELQDLASRLSTPEPLQVTQQDEVDRVCASCREGGRFGFDTEFVMEDRFESEVCLIQIATPDLVAVIDPFLDLDLREIWGLVIDDKVETIVHAGQEDLALCVQHADAVPRRVYDIQIAAGFAGYDYPLSLQRLIQATLHVRLHKSKTLTDWRRRPLTEAQIRYGAEDVCYLLAVRDKLERRLSERGRVEWAAEEFARFEEMPLYRRADEEKLVRVKGAGSMDGKHLAVLRELLRWRETISKQLNRPVRVVLKDHLLVEIAKLGLCVFEEVRDLRGLNLKDRHVHALCAIVTAALTLPQSAWPTAVPRDSESPAESALIALVTGVIRGYCVREDIAYALVASKKSIRALIRLDTSRKPVRRAAAGLLAGWRHDAIGSVLEDVLAGKRSIRVNPEKGNGFIEVTE